MIIRHDVLVIPHNFISLYNYVLLFYAARHIILSSYDQHFMYSCFVEKHSSTERGRRERSDSLQMRRHLAL